MTPSQDRLGKIIAGHRLGRDAMVLLGWSDGDLPNQGVARLQQRQQGRGRFVSLTLADDQKQRWFLLVIHAVDFGLAQSGESFQLHGSGAQAATTAYVPQAMLEVEAFVADMRARLGALADDAVRFLVMIAPTMTASARESYRVLLSTAHATGQDMGKVKSIARAALLPGYTGQDTVSSLPLPVRLVVDLTARVAGAGWYVTGWLLDPAKLVKAVTLRGPSGAGERLDTSWTRLSREDVTASYCREALFDGRITDDLHGFTVFVAGVTMDHQAWIELELGGHGCAYMPVSAVQVTNMADCQRVLSTVDLHKAAATEIIERQLGPLFHARSGAPNPKSGYRALRQAPGHGRTALIVPLTDGNIKSNVVVSRLAHGAVSREAQIVLVCSPSPSDAMNRLLRDLDFYGLAADVLVADDPVDSCEALEIGVEATSGANFVFLSPSVHAVSPNWLRDIIALLGDGTAPCVISPTLLYEDDSIRYTGVDAVQFSDAVPYAAAVSARAGHPRDAQPHSSLTPTLSAAIECCAMTRTAFKSVGGFSQGYALDDFKGVDLFLRMREAGVRISWLAAVELYAMDAHDAAAEHISQVARRVDGWSFKAAWQEKRSSHTPSIAHDLAPSGRMASLPRVKRTGAAAVG